MKKSLHHPKDLEEILQRIEGLNEDSERQWGKMSPAQMLRHCDRILQISTGKIILPKINPFVKAIGIFTRNEMKLFNNGIPPNMPTFKQVIIKENCNFEKSRAELFLEIENYLHHSEKRTLLSNHALFGKMSSEDWGFMHYKHLNHHLKQFGL